MFPVPSLRLSTPHFTAPRTAPHAKRRGFFMTVTEANVVVANDEIGNFKNETEAVASAPDHGKARYVIHVKMGTYKEKVVIDNKKYNVMLVGDGLNVTIITADLNFIDGTTIYSSATVGVDGDRFIAKDIWFQNTAG